jgi:O-6-methylguanine DNA methyltransferase
MISVYVKEVDGTWFGLAYVREEIVATATSSTRERTTRNLAGSIPLGVEHQIVEEGSEFAEKTILMLRELESGNEESKRFCLAAKYVPELVAKVLKAAAAIPIGSVASYGGIAKAAGSEPRVVGRIMAGNPLYPIVACHRVVGADFSLVGYGGRKNLPALQAKLARLSKEIKGITREKEVLVDGKRLTVYPVEFVIKKAKKRGLDSGQQKLLQHVKPQRYRVVKDYRSPYPDPIVFQEGEKVRVGQEFKEDSDWKDWIWCEGNNKKAWVPKQYINIDGVNGIFNQDYNAMELSVQVGERLVVYEIVNGFGMSEKTNGTRGWVPTKNMEIEKK